MRVRDLVPRRADGLPPGQRAVRAFPRFSDKPLRWAPPIAPIALDISLDGNPVERFDADRMDTFDSFEQVADFHCVTTWTHRDARWRGVRLTQVMAALDVDIPKFAVAASADQQAAIFLTDDLLADDVMLATHLHGEPLDQRHGGALRLVSPRQYGYKNVKHLIGIDFRSDQPESVLGSKEHLRGRVAEEERHATLPNWALRLPYRATIIPTALAAERGLRRSP